MLQPMPGRLERCRVDHARDLTMLLYRYSYVYVYIYIYIIYIHFKPKGKMCKNQFLLGGFLKGNRIVLLTILE